MTAPSSPLYPNSPKANKSRAWRLGTLYFFLPLILFLFTSIPNVNRLTPFIAVGLLAVVIGARFLPNFSRSGMVILWTLFVLSLVGSSGWFFSPFFFALYLVPIALGFIYTPLVAVAFTLGLLVIFASSVGEVSPTADFLTLISLLSVIPITIALRRSFLLVQQEKRGILILESEQAPSGLTSLESVLNNQVNKIAVNIRQPVTYIRQAISLLKDNTLEKEEYTEVIDRMSKASDEVYTLLKEFESDTTNNQLLHRTTRIKKP